MTISEIFLFRAYVQRKGKWAKFWREWHPSCVYQGKIHDAVYLIQSSDKQEAHEKISQFLGSDWEVGKIVKESRDMFLIT